MKIKLFAIFAAMAISSFGQLINVIPQAVTPNVTFNNTVIKNIGSYPVFNYNSQTYTNIGALSLGHFKVGTDALGEYKMTVSYLAEYSDGENILSVGNGTTNNVYQNLFSSYDLNNFSYSISGGVGLTAIDFTNTLLGYNITSWQDNVSHFNWYLGTDNTYIGVLDDIGTHAIDYNDMAVKVELSFLPFQDLELPPVAVPEPSTYALLGGIMLLTAALYKRRK